MAGHRIPHQFRSHPDRANFPLSWHDARGPPVSVFTKTSRDNFNAIVCFAGAAQVLFKMESRGNGSDFPRWTLPDQIKYRERQKLPIDSQIVVPSGDAAKC